MPALGGGERQEDHKSKVIHGYLVSLRTVWGIHKTMSPKTRQNKGSVNNEMAQWAKVPISKHDKPSLNPRSFMVEGGDCLLKVMF